MGNQKNSSPAQLHYKKYRKKYIKEKENGTRWECGSTQRVVENQKWQVNASIRNNFFMFNLLERSLFKEKVIMLHKMLDNSSTKAKRKEMGGMTIRFFCCTRRYNIA